MSMMFFSVLSRSTALKASLIAGLLFMSQATTAYSAVAQTQKSSKPSVVNIVADQQIYDQNTGRVNLKGNVEVSMDNITIKSTKAKMVLTETGEPLVANFFNRPTAVRTEMDKGHDDLVADIIRILMQDNLVRAEGNVVTHVTTVAADPFHIVSDTQQFNNVTKTVRAEGKVKVNYKEMLAQSPKAILKVGPNGKADQVLFFGGATLTKEGSEIAGDNIKITVANGNMIAEGKVDTKVNSKKNKRVRVKSDYQQYDKNADTMLASGNVIIVYEDYVATGPKATFRMNEGEVELILLTGRPTITDKDRQITANTITITTNPKKFNAVGNVKTKFKTDSPSSGPAPATSTGGTEGEAPTSAETGKAPAPLSNDEQEMLNY